MAQERKKIKGLEVIVLGFNQPRGSATYRGPGAAKVASVWNECTVVKPVPYLYRSGERPSAFMEGSRRSPQENIDWALVPHLVPPSVFSSRLSVAKGDLDRTYCGSTRFSIVITQSLQPETNCCVVETPGGACVPELTQNSTLHHASTIERCTD